MNGQDIDKWSDGHLGRLSLLRTIIGFLNLLIGTAVLVKVFGWLG